MNHNAVDNGTSESEHVGQPEAPTETAPLIASRSDENTCSPRDGSPTLSASAPGVACIESFSSRLTPADRVFVFVGILIIGWSYGLDGLVRYTYQSYAASSLGVHTLLSTINVLRSVISAAVYTPAAKLADVAGRFELIAVSVAFYIIGTVIESTATSIHAFIAGAILYQIGYTCVVLLVEVIIADISSMRSRVFFSYIPAVPFLVNTWISGNLTSAVLKTADWRWGIGMWSFIYAISAAPLLISLYKTGRHGKAGERRTDRSPFQLQTLFRKYMEICHQLDVVGIGLMVAILTLILTPLTIAEGEVSKWRNPIIIVPLVMGGLCVPVFVYWETYKARYPFVPGHLLKDRGVGSALAVRCLLNFAWAVQGNYLYTVLIVAFDFSITVSTQISTFFTFFGVVSGLIVGVVIFKIRRLKYFIVAGTCLFLASFGLMITFNSGTSHSAKLGIIGAQLLLGVAAGFCAYPTQASIQAATKHEHVSGITGLYLATFNIGNAFGTSASGVIWSKNLLPTLESNLAFQPNKALAQEIYQSPFDVVPSYPVGTEIRSAIISSYGDIERLLCVTGLFLCVPMIGFALAARNPKLSAQQSQPEAERGDMEQ